MFFGGGGFRQDVRRRRSSHGQSNNQREPRHEQGGIGNAQLLQLLPLFLLILSSFLSMPTHGIVCVSTSADPSATERRRCA